VFHVELRQFPHQTRAFNLTREQVQAWIVTPWLSGAAVELDERRWIPDKAKLTIYEAPPLPADQLGLGRGWANVTRTGEDVTARLLAEMAHPAPVAELKRELAVGGTVSLGRLLELAGARYPQSRVSERLALCEQAVWELLHEGAASLAQDGAPVARERWQATLLDWSAWRDEAVTLHPGPLGD
jgi:hypothetical protein